ncbi:DUF4232 domain-containing protein [Haloechinothrix halophila]|uniref:DUF4232 domain-containing protein n=1 Tax=Haloechinothrix halophila TaxID=1069073 RepID=UPI0006888405|nr:DUF4232 domain-containing protein [Haloechinothrix halophila]
MAHRPARRSGPFGTCAVVIMAALLAGCGDAEQPSVGGQETTSATTSPSPATASPEPSTTASTPNGAGEDAGEGDSKPQANPGLCTSGDLELSLGPASGAAGTVWRPLRFTNVSGGPCEIQGFPGVSYVAGDDGHQVGAAAYREGSKGAAVTLTAGETAFAAVGFTQVGNYDPKDCQPTKVRGLRVYPPQETHSKFVRYERTGCANEDLRSHHLRVRTIEQGTGPA